MILPTPLNPEQYFYHSVSIAMVKRFNQTLMTCTLQGHQKNTEKKSPVRQLFTRINVTIHGSTGYSLYFLMFGCHQKLVIDAFLVYPIKMLTQSSKTKCFSNQRYRLALAYIRVKEAALVIGKLNKNIKPFSSVKFVEVLEL